jgi:hypothetical protein
MGPEETGGTVRKEDAETARRRANFQTRRRNAQHQADWRRRRDSDAILTDRRLEVVHRDNSDDDGKRVPDLPLSPNAARVGQPGITMFKNPTSKFQMFKGTDPSEGARGAPYFEQTRRLRERA